MRPPIIVILEKCPRESHDEHEKRLLDKHSAVIAILVSTLLFALIHLPDYIQAFNASVGGIVAGILYFKSKRIVIPILFHITWNLIAELDNFFKLPFM